VKIRPATPKDSHPIARVHIDSWRATYPGIVPDAVLARLNYGDRERWWYNVLTAQAQDSIVFVAEDDKHQIWGFATGGVQRDESLDYAGELYAIYLDGSIQGQGVGRRLVNNVAAALVDRNYQSMLVWVLADNPARGFYEALGGTYVTEKSIDLDGDKPLSEVAYGWPDIQVLAGEKEKR
jgi:ribosomal protein S18 acetylase RimI-like enzyme